jgi:hypothetical protein
MRLTDRCASLTYLLPTIRVPTLALHRKDNEYVRVENGRYVAERIPGAKSLDACVEPIEWRRRPTG